jgi:hypothetical protein
VLTNEDLLQLLARLKLNSDRAAEALQADDVPPLVLAEAAVELGKLGDRLGKLAGKLEGGGGAGGKRQAARGAAGGGAAGRG